MNYIPNTQSLYDLKSVGCMLEWKKEKDSFLPKFHSQKPWISLPKYMKRWAKSVILYVTVLGLFGREIRFLTTEFAVSRGEFTSISAWKIRWISRTSGSTVITFSIRTLGTANCCKYPQMGYDPRFVPELCTSSHRAITIGVRYRFWYISLDIPLIMDILLRPVLHSSKSTNSQTTTARCLSAGTLKQLAPAGGGWWFGSSALTPHFLNTLE